MTAAATGMLTTASKAMSGSVGEESDDLLLDLVSEDDVTHRAVRSGAWTDPDVWANSVVPRDGARVVIEEDVTVTIAHELNARLRSVRVEGTLRFDPSVDTQLKVDTVVTLSGSALRIGTAEEPVASDVEARIVFIDTGPINKGTDPKRIGRGLIARGDLSVHGAPMTSWTALSSAPSAGDQELALSESPTNWEAGDRVVVPGVLPNEEQDEVRRIESVDGATVRLDGSLEHDHIPPKADLDSYALNLSRNVVLESEDQLETKRRGHVMIMSTGSEVRYALFDGLGRTNKNQVFTNPERGEEYLENGLDRNPKARYALHYHKTGIEADPHRAEGVVVDGSPGWGVVNHHSHAEVTDSVTYDVLGAGFVAEGGNERGRFARNFALRSEGSGEPIDSRNFVPDDGRYSNLRPSQTPTNRVDDFGHAGHGFWLQSPLVEMVDNVAAGHRHYAYIYWTRPLLDGPMAEATEPVADRQGTVPNLPLEYVEGQEPLKQAIKYGRGPPGEHASMNPEKISSAFVRIKRFEGNEAFASAGGLDLSRNQFNWAHERFSGFSVIQNFTAYGIGPHIDEDGNVRGVVKRGVKKGGNQGIKLRYVSNVTIRNSRLLGRERSGVGIAPHDYLWTAVIENSTIEGWHLGVGTGEHRLTWVRNNVFDNEVDLDWVIGNTGPLVAEDNSLDTFRYALSLRDVKADELFSPRPIAGARVNGRSAYFDEQRADYVPIESEDELSTATVGGGFGNMTDVIDDDPANVIGLTNRELMDRYGVATAGAVLPEEAVDVSYVAGGELAPAESDGLPRTVWVDPTTGSVGDGFNVVSEPEASNNQCLRVNETGTASPPQSVSNFTKVTFDCAAGTYAIFGRIWTNAWNGDTVFFRVDGGEWLAAEKLKQPRGFKWFEAAPNNGAPYELELSEGEHTIEIGCANDGVLIDKLLIAQNPAVVGGYGGAPRTNAAPDVSNDELSVKQGESGTIDVLANDSDPDGSLDASTVRIAEPPSNGSLSVRGGEIEYAHDGSATNTDSFGYKVADDDGATSKTTVTVSIEPNDSPAASSDDITVKQGRSTTVDVLANDSDPDGSLDFSTVTITTDPSRGTAVATADGTVEYSHDGTNTSADSFAYTVADDDGATSEETTVSVSVKRTDDEDDSSTGSSDDDSNGRSGDESNDNSDNESGNDSNSGSDDDSGGESNDDSGDSSGDDSNEESGGGSDSQSPYTDHDLTRIQAEDFDIGGEGVAYHDADRGNKEDVYRDTNVDLQETEDDSGGYNIGWINRDEWWEYTVDVPEDGEYDLTARLAGKNATSLDIAVDGSQVATVDVPNTGGWQEWTTVEAGSVELSAGTRTIRVTATGGDFNFNWIGFEQTETAQEGDTTGDPSNDNQSPYTDHDLGRIQAEDFDIGGEGVAYHDADRGNKSDVYRDTNVDLQETEDDSGGYNIGWINRDEWWEYTVDVPEDGEYTLQVRLAGKNATSLDVAVDGSQVTTVDVPNTGGWQEWTTVEAGSVELSAGTRTIRVTATGGDFNFNWIGFE